MQEMMWGTGFALADNSNHYHHHHGSNHRNGRSKKNSRTGQECAIAPQSSASSASPANLRRHSYSCKPAAPSSDRGSDQGAVQYYESARAKDDSAAEADAGAVSGLCVSKEIQDNFKRLEVLAHRHASASPSPSASASPSRTGSAGSESSSVASRRTKAPPALATLLTHIQSRTMSSESPTSRTMSAHSAGSATPRVLSVTPVSASSGARLSPPPSSSRSVDSRLLSPPPSSSRSVDSRLPSRQLEQWQRPSDLSSSIEGISSLPSFERSGSSGSARSDDRRLSVPLVLHCKPLLSPEPSSPPPERAPSTPIVCSRALSGESFCGSPSSTGTPRTPRVLPVTPVTLRKRMSLSRSPCSPESPPSWASPSLLRRFSLNATLHVV